MFPILPEMKLSITISLLLFIIASALAALRQDCEPKNFFWRPYNGEIPSDAYIAKTGSNNKKYYIAKVVTPESETAAVPVLWREDFKYVNVPLCCNSDTYMKVNKFVEILCVEDQGVLSWESVENAVERCCLLEGGIGWNKGGSLRLPAKKWYIGKELKSGYNAIGKATVTVQQYFPRYFADRNQESNVVKAKRSSPTLVYDPIPRTSIFATMEKIENKDNTIIEHQWPFLYHNEDFEVLVYDCQSKNNEA